MHCVLTPVGGSLAAEDPYMELVLDPRVKTPNVNKKLYTIQKPATEVAGTAQL